MNRNKKIMVMLSAAAVLSGCANSGKLQGTWQYSGGIYNGKAEGETEGYKLQRKYTDGKFEAYMIDEGTQPQKYQAGDYKLSGDSCLETETFSAQPTNLTGVTLHYAYQIKNDTLVLKGKLPSGMDVEEYWKKLK